MCVSLVDMDSKHSFISAFQRLRPRLRRLAVRLLGSEADADDAVQEAFLRLWGRECGACPEAAAVTAVRSAGLDALRRREVRRAESLDVVEPPSDESADDLAELYAEVNALVERHLSERERTVLLLRDRDEWEFDAIAARLGLSEPNVRLILSRARCKVRTIYQERHHIKS